MRKHSTWFWASLFVFVLLILGTLAAFWNVLSIQHYQEKISQNLGTDAPPWHEILFGSIGFLVLVTAVLMVFPRLFREMKLTQTQKDFLAQVSHELKTPIATIELTATLLGKKIQDPLLDLQLTEIARLKREVEYLLEAARLEAGAYPAKPQPIAIDQWIEASLPRWREVLGPGSTLELEGTPLHSITQTDPRALDLIATNLLDNARKFARDGSPRLRIIRGKTKSGWKLVFMDSGMGFEPKSAKRIFKRFYRDRHAAEHAIAGSGLGLYIAYEASRSAGLELKASSQGPGSGASFVLEGRTS